MYRYRRKGTPLSSLIEQTFALESRNKKAQLSIGRIVNYTVCACTVYIYSAHTPPIVVRNTDDRNSGVRGGGSVPALIEIIGHFHIVNSHLFQ